jgi:2-keto-3-deoxy-L-fuconate dehydrogenase
VLDGRPEIEPAILETQKMGRMGKPEEIAAAAVWLSSDDASFVTGHALCVDGAWTAH